MLVRFDLKGYHVGYPENSMTTSICDFSQDGSKLIVGTDNGSMTV